SRAAPRKVSGQGRQDHRITSGARKEPIEQEGRVLSVVIDFPHEIEALRHTHASIAAVTHPEELKARIAELSEQASAPDLWDDPDSAQEITSELSQTQAELKRLTDLEESIDDLETLVEMAEEEDDADTLDEAKNELGRIGEQLSELEIRTLLSGEFDQRDAVVTIRAGAGGIDAADFAEMLMRMYLRWAERRGYPTKVLDTSYAEEAGLKSVTFEVKAPYAYEPGIKSVALEGKSPYAYGSLSVEGGTPRLVRNSPFDSQGRRHTSFAAVEVVPVIEKTDHIEIPEAEIKVDVFRSSGPGG